MYKKKFWNLVKIISEFLQAIMALYYLNFVSFNTVFGIWQMRIFGFQNTFHFHVP